MQAGVAGRRESLSPTVTGGGSVGLRTSLPIGVLLHAALVWLFLHSSLAFRADRLPSIEFHRVRLFAPPAAARRLGDPTIRPEPEDLARPPGAASRRAKLLPLLIADLSAMLDSVSRPSASFGAETGVPDGVWDGLEFGRPDGVVGGLAEGIPGGRIGALPGRADPVLSPPDEPPAPIAMPRPRFPREALRDGIRGRVVLRALIDPRGTVEVLRILRSVPGLDAEAVRVVESEWRFRPARRDGRPVPALSDLVVRFSLR